MAKIKILFYGNDVESDLDFYTKDDLDTAENEKKFDKIISKVERKKSELKIREQDTDVLVVNCAWVERPKGSTDKEWRDIIEMYTGFVQDDESFFIVEVE